MAQYPIVSQRGISSPSGGFRPPAMSFATGKMGLYQAIGTLAAGAINLELTMHLQRGVIELNDATAKDAREDINLDNILLTTEEGEFDKEFAASMKRRQGFMPKNGYAAREYTAYLKRREGGLLETINTAKKARLDDTTIADIETLVAVGNVKQAEVETEAAVLLGVLTETDKGRYLRRAQANAEAVAKQAEEAALRSDIDNEVGRINRLPAKDRMAATRALTGYERDDRNEIIARVKAETDAEIEGTERAFTRSWVEGKLTKPDVLAAGLPSDVEKKWLLDIKKQYDEGPPETSDAARLAVNNAVDAVAMGTLNNAGAIQVFNENKGGIRKEDRGGFLDDIEKEKDQHYSYRRQVGLAQLRSDLLGPENSVGAYPEADKTALLNYRRAATEFNIELDKAKADDKPLSRDDLYALTAIISNRLLRDAGPRREIEDEDFVRQSLVPPLGLKEELVNPNVQQFFQGAPPAGEKPVRKAPVSTTTELPANDNFVFEYLKPFAADPTEFTKVQLGDIDGDLWYALDPRDKKAILDDILKHPTDTQMGKKWNARLRADQK